MRPDASASRAALATATSGLWLFLSHNLTLDMPVAVFLLWTTAMILRVLEKPEDAKWIFRWATPQNSLEQGDVVVQGLESGTHVIVSELSI